jgi:hypothetical protein
VNGNHNGGAAHFGPDGMLYLGVGEGGSSTATDAQDLDKFGGKVLRINTNNPANPAPSDNPFYNAADGIGPRDFVFAYGFRNPFTGAFKPGTSTLYINDVGQSTWEEINDVQRGKNYGWPNKEGNTSDTTYTNPGLHVHALPQRHGHHARARGHHRWACSTQRASFPRRTRASTSSATRCVRSFVLFDPATKTAHRLPHERDRHTGRARLRRRAGRHAVDALGPAATSAGSVRRQRQPRAERRCDPRTKTAGGLPLTINFSGANSADPDADALSYSWNFGDGSTGSG